MPSHTEKLAQETPRPKADPGLGYDEGEPAKETPPPTGDVDQPWDPPRTSNLSYDDGEPGKEPPPPTGDTDQPGDPPPLEVAERNGR